jgi:hypothetical protein
MTDIPDDRPRPTPRPRPGASARPTPRPRVAGSRREREDAATADTLTADTLTADLPVTGRKLDAVTARSARTGRTSAAETATTRGRRPVLALVLALLCVVTAAGAGWLLLDRMHPRYVDATVFSAAKSNIQTLYAFDYHDPDGSVRRQLGVLTGALHDQFKTDLSQGGIIDTYKQVSATTSYVVQDVGLQQINDGQDTATLVVFGQQVLKSVNSGKQAAPPGSECTVTPEGAQSCTRTVQIGVVKVGGTWKINELTVLTTS